MSVQSTTGRIAIAADHDVRTYPAIFKAHRRLHIPGFLASHSAVAIHDALSNAAAQGDFTLNDGRSVYGGSDAGLKQLSDFLSSSSFLDFVRKSTGVSGISRTDALAAPAKRSQAPKTAADLPNSASAIAGYSLTLSQKWRPDWGGVLAFLDDDGNIAEGYAPAFNALNLFAMPQRHMATQLSSFAALDCLSVVGCFYAAAK